MPKGDTYAVQTREIVSSILAGSWVLEKSTLTPSSLDGETLNHRLQITGNAYGHDPSGSDLLGQQLATIDAGLWGNELMSYSHCQHYYSAVDSGVMFACSTATRSASSSSCAGRRESTPWRRPCWRHRPRWRSLVRTDAAGSALREKGMPTCATSCATGTPGSMAASTHHHEMLRPTRLKQDFG